MRPFFVVDPRGERQTSKSMAMPKATNSAEEDGGGIVPSKKTRWLLRAIKIIVIVRGDDQRVGYG